MIMRFVSTRMCLRSCADSRRKVSLSQLVPEPVRLRCKRWVGDLEMQCLRFNNRARQALSLLLVPVKDGDKHGTPAAAESFFDQMEIYPGGYAFSLRPTFLRDNTARQVPRRHISASYTKRQG